MTDRTDNRGYSYPECDPPLVMDRSDIGFLRDLATEVNADAQALDDRIETLIERPAAARQAFAASLVIVKSSIGDAVMTIPYSSTTYANPASFSDLAAFGLRIPERGFYMFTSYVRTTTAGLCDLQVRHLRNGLARTEGRRFEGPGFTVDTAIETSMQTSDVFPCNAGDLIRTQIKLSPVDGTYAFEARLSGILLLPLDVT